MEDKTSMYNALLRWTTLSRDNVAAAKADSILFGQTRLAKRPDESISGPTRLPEGPSRPLDIPSADVPINPDLHSLISLIPHLTVTSQFSRLEDLTYKIIPFLAFSKSMTPEQIEASVKETRVEPSFSGRPRPETLPLILYAVLLVGLEKSSKNALASRVFSLALQSEAKLTEEHFDRNPDTPIAASTRLMIDHFTTMLLVWDNELRSSEVRRRRNPGNEDWPRGWSVPPQYGDLPRREAAQLMIDHTYDMARDRWLNGEDIRPDTKFFNAMLRACSQRWEFGSQALLKDRDLRTAEKVVRDIRMFRIDVPPVLEAKCGQRDFPDVSELGQGNRERSARVKYVSRKMADLAQGNNELRRLADMQLGEERGIMTQLQRD